MHITEFYKTKRIFLQALSNYVADIDIPSSVSKSKYTIQIKNKVVFARNMGDLLQKLNTIIGEEVFINGRLVGRQGFKVVLDKEVSDKLLGKGSPAVAKIATPEVKVAEKPVQEEPVVVEPEVIVEESVKESEVVSEESSTEVDWEWIESLQDNKDSKLALDQYAEEKFDIKLKRNMKLPNMIAAFKEALEAK
ncbi:conserved hypothetical protein [Vibrio phage 424E50-1]|nr:conserved hypothetical protein [Vibrio phage 424E50-1]